MRDTDPALPDRIARALYEWQRDEPYVLDDNYPGKRCFCCNPGGASDIIREVLSAQSPTQNSDETVAAVLALHKPVQRWLPYPDAEWSYATEQEAREWDDDTKPTPFTVCDECGRIEMGRDDYDAPDYEASLWPCRTAKACGITGHETEPCTTCGGAPDSPACSLSPDTGRSGHTYGGVADGAT